MPDQALIELLRGEGSHADPVACVGDLPAGAASTKIAGFPQSIWQIVFHMNYWMDYELRRICGERPAYPAHAAESWPAPEESISDAGWKEVSTRFASLIDQLGEMAQSEPAVLTGEVEPLIKDHHRHASSLSAVLWQTAVHNSYHIGQIVLLRRALGAWPPPSGGDSW